MPVICAYSHSIAETPLVPLSVLSNLRSTNRFSPQGLRDANVALDLSSNLLYYSAVIHVEFPSPKVLINLTVDIEELTF